ncbi:MAG: type II toxin-antitoxin system VapC family toxin [Acidimicrobiales bacterium]
MSRVVLDASAAVEIALDTDTGLRLAGRLSPDDEVIVPDHFYAETGAALRRMEARGVLSVQRTGLALSRILTLATQRVSTKSLLSDAWQLRANVTIGDAIYVALARRTAAPLMTADRALAGAPRLGIVLIS